MKLVSLLICLSPLALASITIPNVYLIEFDNRTHVKRNIDQRRNQFYEQLDSLHIQYNVRHEYNLIHAVSLEFKSPRDTELFFESAMDVKRVWPVSTVAKPKIYQADNVPSIAPLFSFYKQTGVTKLREKLGLTGKGIKVGVIDTGVDYTHHALGGCFGPGCRVAYGYDFVGDAYTGDSEPQPDDDPRDTCNGHGTHVAGIIGANDKHMNLTGVAPDVTFGAYRIFGCSGGSSTEIIMKAMEAAYLDGMDVVNLSLGDIGWPESPASVLADELSLQGMIVCAAAGNEGERGIFEVGSPSLGKHAISVASVDNAYVLSHVIRAGDLTIGYLTATGNPFIPRKTRMIPLSNQFLKDNDGCDPITVNLKNTVVLVSRGGCLFTQKIINAEKAGAAGIIFYNNLPGPVMPSAPESNATIEYGGISKEDGERLFEYLKTNSKVEFLKYDHHLGVSTAGAISSFSSWGLGPDLSVKPDISAPGGQIFSTYPVNLGSYTTLSGTSMASPFVAGIVALLEQAKGGQRSLNIQELRASLMNNGHLVSPSGSSEIDSVARQGAGLIDAYQAISSTTLVTPEQIRLSDEDHGAENNEYILTIKNNGRLHTEYTISHQASITAQGFDNNRILKKPIPIPSQQASATVEIPQPVVFVEANEEATVTVRIIPPNNIDQPSIYSGYIVISGDTDDDVKYVPYAGLTSSLSKIPVLVNNGTMPRVVSGKVNMLSPALISFQLAESSALITVTVIDAVNDAISYGYVPEGYITFLGRSNLDDPNDVFLVSWHGNVVDTPEKAAMGILHRSTLHPYHNFMVSSSTSSRVNPATMGALLEKGKYRLKIMALHPLGDAGKYEDYDTWISPEITLD
ncbi:hypothetical protein RMATCC62417_03744 [Rhizopus microsporus]|nr:hypothetical protein RMATCC62417_03744 [Rhizopus microsporus]